MSTDSQDRMAESRVPSDPLGAIGSVTGLEAAWLASGLAAILVVATIGGWWRRRRAHPPAPESGERTSPGAEVRPSLDREELERTADRRMKEGQVESALALYYNAGNLRKVAQCYLKLRQPAKAAETYRELGRLAEAAHYFQVAGDWVRAAQCLYSLDHQREAAELYERAGELAKAAEILESLGDHDSASRLYVRGGLGARAADALLQAKGRSPAVLKRAAELYERAGSSDRAAACWTDAGELGRAAALLEDAGAHERAGQLYARMGSWAKAGNAYARARCFAEARSSYERAGNPLNAAKMALELGEHLDAARGFYAVGSYERAIESLQAIPSSGTDAREANLLAGRIFLEKGLFERTRERLEAIAPETPRSKDDLEILAMLAEATERNGDPMSAISILEKILDVDEDYGDCAGRLRRLQEQMWGGSLMPSMSGGSERYELRDEIGRGGMGIVHLAWDKELERPVAIKFLPAELAHTPEALKMFRQEARAAAAMNHPHIVHIYDVAVISMQPCIVMEYVRGRTVRELMRPSRSKERQPLSARRVAEIAREICHALAYAHSQNVVHRDIKPGNLIVDGEGRAKLMDFGISKVLEAGGEGRTDAKGTPQYMPPEQILGDEIDGRTDLYALGISMFEMATGQRPFRGDKIVDQQLHSELPDPRSIRSCLPEELVEIIRTACQKQPGDRFPSANEMAAALSRFLESYEGTR